MRLNIGILVLVSIAIMIISSCAEEKLVLSDKEAGFQFYPVEVGNYWVYRVDSTVVPGFKVAKLETSSFLREEIASSFINSQGDTAYVIQRSFSATQDGPFRFTDRWTLEKNGNQLVRIEENLQFLKIIFPIVLGDVWDGTRFDEKVEILVAQQPIEPYKQWEFEVLGKNSTITSNGVNYTEVLEIQQVDYENEIELRQAKEYYAADVGLVYKEMTILDTQCFSCEGDTFLEKAEAGFILKQFLIEHN